MREIISSDETEAVLLVDASNAFNTINRQAALHNIGIICPSLSRVLNNTYQAPVRLFVTGGAEIESSEGITQGDSLAMAMYALNESSSEVSRSTGRWGIFLKEELHVTVLVIAC
jgi:hypothetical protein